MSHTHVRSDINITPLIDIVLVLLVVFIILVPSLAKVSEATLPRRDGPTPPPGTPAPLVVGLDAAGGFTLQREALSADTLVQKLGEALQLQPWGDRRVFLKVQGEQPHQQVVWAMDRIRVASDQAREATARKTGSNEVDGGPARIVLALQK